MDTSETSENVGGMKKPKKVSKKTKQKRYFDIDNDKEKGNQGGEDVIVTDLSKVDYTKGFAKNNTLKLQKKKEQKKLAKQLRKMDPFPGPAPIPKEKVKKYKRGHKMDMDGLKTKHHKGRMKKQEEKVKQAARQAARTEMLLPEQAGYIEADEGEVTSEISQHEIASCVDVTSAQKFFELTLDKFGPYKIDYTRNGRFLLMGGKKGHVAAFDWLTKKLMCEVNVMETCQDVKWLHNELMFAVAQKQWVYIYDNQGVELHCLKTLDSVLSMEFLPYHFLLATANARSYLSWLDVSVGQKVAGFTTGLGRLDIMCQNPANAIVHLGHSGGTVTLWSPNVKEPLVKMLCHGGGTRSIAVNHTGQYMATSGVDRTLKLWDLRMFKVLQKYKVPAGPGQLAFSQRGVVAAAMANVVEIYKDPVRETVQQAYLSHRLRGPCSSLKFCPYEDVLGVGHAEGFSSILVPGAGEPNFDALEANPYQTKKQRQQAEVKMLLDKVQPDMISLDTSALGKIDKKTLEDKMEERKNMMYLKPQDIDFAPKYKMKGRSKGGKVEKRKQGVREENRLHQVKEHAIKKIQQSHVKKSQIRKDSDVFSRFKEKKV